MLGLTAILEDPTILFVDTYFDKFEAGSKERELLSVFAYGTWKDYRELEPSLPESLRLQPGSNSCKKLKKLTLLSIFATSQCCQFEDLMEEISVDNFVDLESLVIDLIANDYLDAKIDEQNHRVVCIRCAARCLRNEKQDILARVEQLRKIRGNIAMALSTSNP